MSRRTSRSTSYTSGVNPVGPFRAKVVSVSGGLASIQIPRLGMNNVYDEVPYSGFVPTVGAIVWAFFIEGNASRPMIVVSSDDSQSDINEIIAGTNLNGGGTGGSVTVNLDATIALSSVTADNFYGALTGDVTGNADTATALATARTIGGVSFDGTSNINLPGVNTGGSQDTSGNAATATVLATARAINGVNFDGSAAITVTAAAGTLTGATLNSGVTASSLTSVGTLTSLNVTGGVTGNVTGDVTGNADTATTATNLSGGSVAATTLTASGDANFDSGTLFVDVSTNRVGINTSSPTQTLDVNGILNVSGDIRYNNNAIVASYASSTNIDHIWHDETNNAWNFVSDSTYKAAGNSALNAATLNGTTVNATTVNATTVNLNTSVHLTNVDADGSMRVQGNNGYIDVGPKNSSYAHIYTDRGSFYFNKNAHFAGTAASEGGQITLEDATGASYSVDWSIDNYQNTLRMFNSTLSNQNVSILYLNTTTGNNTLRWGTDGSLLRYTSLTEKKEDIESIDGILGYLNERNPLYDLSPKIFHEKDGVDADGEATNTTRGEFIYGMLAEDVYEVLPEVCNTDGKGRLNGYAIESLIPLLVAEIQRLGGLVGTLYQAHDSDYVPPTPRQASRADAEKAVFQNSLGGERAEYNAMRDYIIAKYDGMEGREHITMPEELPPLD